MDFDRPVVSTKRDWREQDAKSVNRFPLEAAVFNEQGELTDPPDCTPRRMLRDTDTSDRKKVLGPGTKEDIELIAAVEATVNEMTGKVVKDNVVLPEHYARFKIEPIRFIVENGLSFLQGNIIKYVCRFDAKNGLEDVRKAGRYLVMLERRLQGNPDWWKK
jgi:hypothetical protein